MKPIPPCAGCLDRKIGCHSECEKYIDYKCRATAYSAMVRNARGADVSLDSFHVETKRNSIRRHRRY